MGTPLSMKDLSLVQRLDELRAAGVAALKIEGRMKTADWVSQAVGLYRRALAGADVEQLAAQAEALGAYTGRQLTYGYLDGDYDDLTGTAGREAAEPGGPRCGNDRRRGIRGRPAAAFGPLDV